MLWGLRLAEFNKILWRRERVLSDRAALPSCLLGVADRVGIFLPWTNGKGSSGPPAVCACHPVSVRACRVRATVRASALARVSAELRASPRECKRGRGRRPGLARPLSPGRASAPRGSSDSWLWAQRRREGSVVTLRLHWPLPPLLFPRPQEMLNSLHPLWTGWSGMSRAGAVAGWSSGSRATEAPQRGGEHARWGCSWGPTEASRGPA